jgi:predicted MFS family arabinose efflux permease
MFSFAGFETTLSLLIKGEREASEVPFHFSWGQVCLTYAYIGFTLATVQGGIVRRLAGYWSEGRLALFGGILQIGAFGLVIVSINAGSILLLLVSLGIVVAGVSFMSPNLNSMISRRSDPARQGVALGVTQSVSSLARILGSAFGIPMLRLHLTVPYVVAAALMGAGLVLLVVAIKSGADYSSGASV